MKRLLWKEFRERGWWALCWIAAILTVSFFGHGQFFCGESEVRQSVWVIPLLLFTLLVGTGAYTSEATAARASFLFSRPVSWRAVLLAKVLFAVIIMVGTPLLAALLFRIFGPAEYRSFATLPHLLTGAWAISWKMSIVYLFGMASSVLIPGYMGGMLAMISILLVSGTAFGFLPGLGVLSLNASSPAYSFKLLLGQTGLVVGILLGVICAGLLLARYGLTLSVDARLKRYIPVFIAVSICAWLIMAFIPLPWAKRMLLHWEAVNAIVSPNGQYACILYQQRFNPLHVVDPTGELGLQYATRMFVTNLKDGTRAVELKPKDKLLPEEYCQQFQWASESVAYYTIAYSKMYLIQPSQHKELLVDACTDAYPGVVSPNRKYICVVTYKDGNQSCSIVNLQTGQVFADEWHNVHELRIKEATWESNSRLGYTLYIRAKGGISSEKKYKRCYLTVPQAWIE